MRGLIHTSALLILAAVVGLSGCGSDSSSGSSSGGGGATLSGTAATGAAIANATITISDAAGVERTATTNVNGDYSLDVAGLTPPFLVQVDDGAGLVLYSIGVAAGTANIHPLTDLIVRTWYEVQGTTADAAFADTVASPAPSAEIVAVIEAVVKNIIAQWLTAEGIDPATFDLFTTPFDANSAGFDAVLDQTTVDVATGTITVDLPGADEQITTIDTTATGDISVSTTVTIGGITSSSFTSAFVPATDEAAAAVTGILTALSTFADAVNANGAGLTGAHLAPFFDAAFLDRGENATQGAASFAEDLAGATIDAFVIDSIQSFNAETNVMTINGQVTQTADGVTVTQMVNEQGEGLAFHKQADGTWRFYGDQRRAQVRVAVITEQRRAGMTCSSGCDDVYHALQIQLNALATGANQVSSATVTGLIGGSVQTLPLTKNNLVFSESGIDSEHFDLTGPTGWWYEIDPANAPPAGSEYTFVITFDDLSEATYTAVVGGSTAEAFDLAAGVETTVGHSASATLGNPVTLTWVLPVTFPIAEVSAHGFAPSATHGCDVEGPHLAPTATSVTITLPTTCNGDPVETVLSANHGIPSINVDVIGVNGERTQINYMFHDPV